ncbi:TadE/TadG family type IV pilus assembly protein [Mesorhizobium sp. SP-1A]|uniref:TadE/TadG family type IV pilus assembly protein n=1 Tax=Mesorhizobium sp. SP-1A TaxID=3077840 RepID=UPI0028F6CB31|nr:TadE/TadG family type IV pilus assembly protein [Mesorhizobium sp. SP-1A]
MFAGIRRALAAFRSDRRGVAAIEFAFIAPILMAMYFLSMEITQAIEANKKVSRIGSMVADLVAQQKGSVSATDLNKMMQIAQTTLAPYNRSAPTVTITGIQVTTDPTPKVLVSWSRKMVNGAFSAGAAVNSPATVPAALRIAGTFIIRVDSQLAYKPVITWAAGDKGSLGLTAAFDNIDMSETYFLRPRISSQLPCTGC